MNPAPQPRVVLKSNSARETAIAIACVAAILGVLVWGVMQLREKPAGNTLTGEIVAKEFTPLKEEIVEFKGRSLKATRTSEGEFLLKVRVDSEGGRIFEVPVGKAAYQAKKEGNSMTFVRPRSEQK